ncbi:MAG TPA: choice-of-anchor J domain-containing protein, partial [Candidatus Syntrophosphaera sp.]|nr:choice-of-anchor J domain-containing protein [Candidatus Syntrophosphaera sp.]
MKKIILFALLLLTAVCALADTYIIGTGTSTGSTNPFCGLYDYSWSKVIYTATELSTAGMSASAEISGLGFYVGNTPANYTMLDQRVYVRHTSLANYGTATDETGTGYPNNANFTQVFQGNLTYNGGGWHYLNFSTNFEWNGTDGLEFLFENWDADYVTGYPTFRYTSTSTNYMTVYKAQDNSFPAVAGTRSYNRSNITIVTPSTEPPNPAVLIYPANGGWMFLDGALSWSDGGGMPTGYDVYLDTADGSTLVSDNQTGTTFDPELAEETTYYWKVVPYNANGSAADCPVWSFQTPSTTQLAESFDATAFPPVGWANPGTWSRSTTTPFYGAGTAYKSASTTPALLATPLLDIQAGETLDFYYRTSSTTGYGLMNIKYSADKVTWNQIGTTISMPTTTDWIHTSVNLNTLAGNNYFLAFEVFTSTSTSSIYVDHVFGPEFAAVAPGPATPTAPANNAVDVARYPNFTWTAPTTGGMPAGYRIYCDTNPDPTTLLGTVTSGTTLSWTSTTALNYATLYYWKVVAYNPSGEATGNTVFSFTTMADPTIYTLPWMEDFGTTGATFPPTNWTRWSG